jgi:glycerophosphoryl diester phosphodiesterase
MKAGDPEGRNLAGRAAAAPITVEGPRGPIRLKWHKLRNRLDEAPFKPANLALGWQIGASLEIDIMTSADGRFVVLHDSTLGPVTTGRGRVSETPLAAMAGLLHRDRHGIADADAPVLSLSELLAPLVSLPRTATTSLQLDLKVPEAEALPVTAIADAAAAVAGIENAIVVGSMHLGAARSLAAAMPGARLGYDPQRAIERSPDLAAFPERLLRHIERRKAGLTLAYLRFDLVLTAAEHGFPIVDRLLDLGIETDAWTINPGPSLTNEVLRGLLDAGVRQITTDDPAALARRVAELD